MSFRDVLAEAISTVPGLTGHPYIVGDTEPGTTWVRLDRVAYPNPFGGVEFWEVVVVLPQSFADAERFSESHRDAIHAALSPHLALTEMRHEIYQIPDVGQLPTAVFTGHTEANNQ